MIRKEHASAGDKAPESRARRGSGGPRRRTLFLLAVATAVGSMGLAAGGTAGSLLAVEITGAEAAAGLPLGLLVVGSAAAALLVSRRTSSVGWGWSLAMCVLGTSSSLFGTKGPKIRSLSDALPYPIGVSSRRSEGPQ